MGHSNTADTQASTPGRCGEGNLYFFKSYPGDSDVHLGLRTTHLMGNDGNDCLWVLAMCHGLHYALYVYNLIYNLISSS